MPNLLRRFRYWINLRTRASDLAEEIEAHRAMTQEKLEKSGIPAAEARYASRRALGNITLAREVAREVWIWPSLERLWQDVRYGIRGLRQQPIFAATAILTLTVGVAATTTVFSVVEAEMWKPLPFPDVHRLVAAYTTAPGPRMAKDPVSGPDFLDWQAQSQAFEELAAIGNTARRVLRGRDVPEFVRTLPVSSSFFTTLRLGPALGRPFGPEDAPSGRAVILSDACWQRLFGADPRALGRAVVLDDLSYTVVGVMAPDARLVFMSDPDMFVPIDFDAAALRDRSRRVLSVIGRVKQGMTLPGAEAELRSIAARLAIDYPSSHEGRGATIEDLSASSAGYNWRPLYFFLGAAIFVLILSCANVANLLLARALRRQREFAIRAALGGGRAALVRQLLVEGAVLAIPGTAGGLLLAVWAVGLFSLSVPGDYLARGGLIEIDARVSAFALALCCLTTMAFGLAPAMFTRVDLSSTLAAGARAVAGSRMQRRARHALVVGEIMTAFVLVFGAGLFLTSFLQLTRVPLGFEPRDRFTMGIPLTGSRYADSRAVLDFSTQLLERVRAIPGVATSAVATSVPLDSGPIALFGVGGRPRPAVGEEHRALARAVSPGYFAALAIPRRAGREFTDQDVEGSPRVVIINESLARRLFAAENPVGRELALLPGSRTAWLKVGTLQIVGVVSSTKDVGINEVDFNNIYLPFAQQPVTPMQLVVQASVPPATLVDPVRHAVLAVDRDLPVLGVRTMGQRVHGAFRADRFHLLLIGSFALVAIALASVGVYAAMSYAVQQRTAEFGLRLALGAQRSGILSLALGQSVRLGLAGTVLGLGVCLALARVLGNALYLVERSHNGLIYGVTTTDPVTLACACATLMGVAAVAGLAPARRAMRVDPIVALRHE